MALARLSSDGFFSFRESNQNINKNKPTKKNTNTPTRKQMFKPTKKKQHLQTNKDPQKKEKTPHKENVTPPPTKKKKRRSAGAGPSKLRSFREFETNLTLTAEGYDLRQAAGGMFLFEVDLKEVFVVFVFVVFLLFCCFFVGQKKVNHCFFLIIGY